MSDLVWPSDFPNNCPPSDALQAEGVYFRIVKNNPIQVVDCIPVYYQNLNRFDSDCCEPRGLSLFGDITDALNYITLFPKLGSLIAQLHLSKESGRIKHTPRNENSHYTWWTSVNFKVEDSAAIVHPKEVWSK